MGEIKRIEKGTEAPSEKGAGSTYIIPADDMPSGMETGSKYKVIIEGLVNTDDQGASIKVDRIYCEKMDNPNSREDPVQGGIEKELKIVIG